MSKVRKLSWERLLPPEPSIFFRHSYMDKNFDPTKMDAISTIQPTDEFPANTVIDQLESGYMYKDRVLIAARVVVASDQ